ncbi:type II secretion system F family protein [Boseongicola aestuarii]|uniref:Bacterial type II secretion system protein F domain protein n=1 Tax=Boseongicola aestuarii TaxID=1470561 RepID=A0A238IVR3_9RHOB|nr:type II secretion system F family protein [Boseongicola aestuarii]SMX22052.1 Bacterial type II secretion system protein F domain protein [Boseongicola aestuarii]
MFEQITAFFANIGSSGGLIIMGIFIGTIMIVYGFFGGLVSADPVGRRYHAGRPVKRRSNFDAGLLNSADVDPKGLMKALLPQSREKRTQVRRQLMNAGIVGRNAVAKYYTVRIILAIALPATYLGLMVLRQNTFVPLPEFFTDFVDGQSQLMTYYVLTALVAFGFFGPALWLRSKVDLRQLEISESFPNALDLMQVSVESGLGFDAAMTRVSNEMETSAPAIAQEFRLVQLEISAGGDREKALLDMAKRTNVDEVGSFASVILQSIQFGTSVSEALTTYATEMRISRELKAQEMANKMPVKMSGIMASLMLPALFLLILGPIAIRWMNTFS